MGVRFQTVLARAAALIGIMVLSGCVAGQGLNVPLFDRGTMAPTEVAVTSDRLVIPGPSGWCVDEEATRDDGVTAFVLLGNCAAMSTTRDAPAPSIPAVLTAAISAPSDGGTISESLDGLDTFFRSDEGLSLLSRTGDPSSVQILSTQIDGDMFLLNARDSSAGAVPGVRDTYWRAYFDVGRRIATLTVLALEGRDVSDPDSILALRSFASGVRFRNPGGVGTGAVADPAFPGAAVPATTAPVSTPIPPRAPATGAPSGDRPLFNIGLFRRILG